MTPIALKALIFVGFLTLLTPLVAQETTYRPLNPHNQRELFDLADGIVEEYDLARLQEVAELDVHFVSDLTISAQRPVDAGVCQQSWLRQLGLFSQAALQTVNDTSVGSFLFLYQVVSQPEHTIDLLQDPLRTVQCAIGTMNEATLQTLTVGWEKNDASMLGRGLGNTAITILSLGASAEVAAASFPNLLREVRFRVPTPMPSIYGYGGQSLSAVLDGSQLVVIPVSETARLAGRLAAGGAVGTAALGNVLHIIAANPSGGHRAGKPLYRFNGVAEWNDSADLMLPPVGESEVGGFYVLSSNGTASYIESGIIFTLSSGTKRIQVQILKIYTRKADPRIVRVVVEKLDAAGNPLPSSEAQLLVLEFEQL